LALVHAQITARTVELVSSNILKTICHKDNSTTLSLAKLRQIHSPPADGGVALVTRERQALLAQFSPAAIL